MSDDVLSGDGEEKEVAQEEFHAKLSKDDGIFEEKGWQKYRNEELGFEMMYPGGWYVKDEEDVIVFSSYEPPEESDEKSEQLVNIEDYRMSIWICDKESEAFEEVRNGYTRRSDDIISFGTAKNAIELDVDSVRGEVMNESWDMIVPDFKAFLECENYDLVFNAEALWRSEERQKNQLELLKNTLRTFNFF